MRARSYSENYASAPLHPLFTSMQHVIQDHSTGDIAVRLREGGGGGSLGEGGSKRSFRRPKPPQKIYTPPPIFIPP